MFENLPAKVKVVEVGPRDGLQNEPEIIPTSDKVELITALGATGLSHIELTSFVSPKWIPQLADALEVTSAVELEPGIVKSALVPNLKGYERFVASGLDQVALFMSASQSHSRKNINKSIDEALLALKDVIDVARPDGYSIRCYLSVVFECPYEGVVDKGQVAEIVSRLCQLGVDEISLGDTIGAATPNRVLELIDAVSAYADKEKLALHFHDTRGTALANVVAGLECGIKTFDASVGGMGGCPYAPGAAGNLATEDLVYLLHGLGIDTGIDLQALVSAGELAQRVVGRELPGRYLKSALAERARECASTGRKPSGS